MERFKKCHGLAKRVKQVLCQKEKKKMQPDNLIKQIHEFLTHSKKTVSLAESCTGGALAARFTKQPGCSNYFLGSIVAYSNLLKIKALGVDPDLLNCFGAVSGEVVREMALGALKLTGSDYSLAVSGIAGPDGGTELKPIGTIWGAIASQPGIVEVWSFHVKGDRQAIIDQTVQEMLVKFMRVL